ncbi:MAG TPA: glycosyltransferase, partial [Acetobacteraceae bacterium]|nr:glycosyltransferase [Acetobacteraceae bacterium]
MGVIPIPDLALPSPAEGRAGRPADAQAAFERGLAAVHAAHTAEARHWLDYAQRLAPADGTITLAVGLHRLRARDPLAVEPLELAARRDDRRDAWLGLVAAHARAGLPDRAAAVLAEMLSRHTAPGAVAGLCDAVALEAEAPGWCGLASGGRLSISLASALRERRLVVALDGRALPLPPGHATRFALALPPDWRSATRLDVLLDGQALLGSPLSLAAMRRSAGVAHSVDGAIRGWVLLPGDPDTDPEVTLRCVRGAVPPMHLRASAPADDPGAPPGGRAFGIDAVSLARFPGAVAVIGPDGRALLGSPFDPRAASRDAAAAAALVRRRFGLRPEDVPPGLPDEVPVAAHLRGPPAPAPDHQPGMAIVVPVHGRRRETIACLDSLLTTVGEEMRVIVVDDASPDPELVRALDQRARAGRIRLIRLPENRGFPAAANAGLRAAAGRDAVLLNSDTLLAPGWLEGLRAAAYSAPDIGTATPLSNDATILSYPAIDGGNPVPDLAGTRRLARLAASANAGQVVEIPTGVGFCLYLRHDCLERVGLFREDLFA